MNSAYLHLILNHIPLIGILIGLLTLISGFVFKSSHVKYAALGIFIFSALIAIPAYLTGEGAEHAVEHYPGVSKEVIEVHEDLGKAFLWFILGLGILSALTIAADRNNKPFVGRLYIATGLLALLLLVFSFRLGVSGGEIRRPEIQQQQ